MVVQGYMRKCCLNQCLIGGCQYWQQQVRDAQPRRAGEATIHLPGRGGKREPHQSQLQQIKQPGEGIKGEVGKGEEAPYLGE